MKSMNKTLMIVIVIVVVALAIFSAKMAFFNTPGTEQAKAELTKQLQNTPAGAPTAPPTQFGDKPTSEGVHLPGNKNMGR
ncbi:MAG TPA: hypothetical protein VKU00_02995 [Chthonomonadaceae bacterium]|nr:hypothetical protein [Chthonomonadaceae bacterium]